MLWFHSAADLFGEYRNWKHLHRDAQQLSKDRYILGSLKGDFSITHHINLKPEDYYLVLDVSGNIINVIVWKSLPLAKRRFEWSCQERVRATIFCEGPWKSQQVKRGSGETQQIYSSMIYGFWVKKLHFSSQKRLEKTRV